MNPVNKPYSPGAGCSIWKKQKTEEARSETAGLFADQNMKRDAPWTAWSKMLQLRGRNGFFNPRSTIPSSLRPLATFATWR
jgi:hypothetical protein